MITKAVKKPVRFKRIDPFLKNQPLKILDIGCGLHSPKETKLYFPHSEYHGVDRCFTKNHQDPDADYTYSFDLDDESIDTLPDEYFDLIFMAHVLEHLQHPVTTLIRICRKLKKGGTIYIEFPSFRSMGLPSREGTLQFCDDATHIHLPNPFEIINVLLRENIRILKAKTRRDPIRIMASPLFLMKNLIRKIRGKKAKSKGLWDIWGFAFFIHGEKL